MQTSLRALAIAAVILVAPAVLPAQEDNYATYLVETKISSGPLDGTVRLLRPNRTLVGKGICVGGRLEGAWKAFLEQGSQIASVTFRNDEADGPVTIFHDPKPGETVGLPSLIATVRRAGTQFDGTVVSYHGNGSKLCERTFNTSGTMIACQAWEKDGTEMPEAKARKLADDLTKADLKIIGIMQKIFRSAAAEGKRTAPTT